MIDKNVLKELTDEALLAELGRRIPQLSDVLKQQLAAVVVEQIRPELKGALSTAESKKELLPKEQEVLLATVKTRFEANMGRHQGIEWSKVQEKLEANPGKMWSLNEMERTGGEPDVVGYDKEKNEYIFNDCSDESPKGRRNVVYDREAQDWLEKNCPQEKCNGNAVDMAKVMGVEILSEEQYLYLQSLVQCDGNTWSWLKTPDDIRNVADALDGSRVLIDAIIFRRGANFPNDAGAFRGSLRV